MFLRDGICQTTKGDSLPGYFVECVSAAGVVQSIYADSSSTPIGSVSGVVNRAKVDERGNYAYFVDDGNYYEKYYDKNGAYQFQRGPFSMLGMDTIIAATADAEDAADRAEAAAVGLEALLSNTETRGAASVAVGTGGLSANYTFAFGDTVTKSGYVSAIRAYSGIGGTILIKRFTLSAGTLTQVGSDIPVSLAVGSNALTPNDFGVILVEEGERLGFFQSAGVVNFASGTEAGTGRYQISGANASSYTSGSLVTTSAVQLGFDLIESPDAVHDGRLDQLAGLVDYTPNGTQAIGRVETAVTGTGLTSNWNLVFGSPVQQDGVVSSVQLYAMTAGMIALKRFTLSGTTFTQVGSDYIVTAAVGLNTLSGADLPYIEVNRGEYLGFSGLNGAVAYTASGTGNNYYDNAGVGNAASFTDAALTTNVMLQLGFTVSLGAQKRDEVGALGRDRNLTWRGTDPVADCVVQASANAAALVTALSATYTRQGVTATVTATPTLATPTAGYARYDLITLNLETLGITVTQGTEKGGTPAAASNGIPALPNSKHKPLFLARVASSVVTFTPLWRIESALDRRVAERIGRDRSRSRLYLPRLLNRISRLASVRIVGFGDSITALASSAASTASANGTLRDIAASSGASQYLADGYSAADVTAWITANPLLDATAIGRASDGGGSIHTRLGWNWDLVAALEAGGYTLGTDLYYDNWGIAGYSSANAVTGSPGSYAASTWLSNAVANGGSAPDVFVLALGMNERGDTATEDRFNFIIPYVQAAGIEVIVMDCPRPRTGTVADWRYTSRVLRRVAEYNNAAFVPFWMAEDDRFGGLGIDPADLCDANNSNHPGIVELAAYGRELVRLF